ncbi:MAG: protein kinase [Dehalococcoidia bacterium]|nr:protein kinase [Dehalococcoidia bacterium]
MAERYGRYEVRGGIGHGGMGTVYRAWDPRFRREVAVKILAANVLADSTARTRFEHEARAIAALEHHAIVPVYDFGEEGGELYLVMRLLSGGSLADRVARGPLPLEELLPVVQRVAEALDHAHARGVVHRDVKPANVLFDGAGNAFLSDFGIARMAEQTASLTGVGVVGSPTYMSPEQAEGRPVTPASDVYSLGATVYEALAGRPPFAADHPLAVLLQHIRDEPPAIAGVQPAVMAAVRRAMAKREPERFGTAGALASALAHTARPEASGPTVATAAPVVPPALPATAVATRVAAPLPRTVVTPAPEERAAAASQPERVIPASGRSRRPPIWIAGAAVVLLGVAMALVQAVWDGGGGARSGTPPTTALAKSDATAAALVVRFKKVSASEDHTCGVKTDGTVACWGDTGLDQATPPT